MRARGIAIDTSWCEIVASGVDPSPRASHMRYFSLRITEETFAGPHPLELELGDYDIGLTS